MCAMFAMTLGLTRRPNSADSLTKVAPFQLSRSNTRQTAEAPYNHRRSTGSTTGTTNAVNTPFRPMPSPENAPISSLT